MKTSYTSAETNCEACNIDHRIRIGALAGVKQMPRHTCDSDGPNNDGDDRLKRKYRPIAQQELTPYDTQRICH